MTKVFAAMHFFENQSKIANDRLENMTKQQDKMLARKESLSIMLDKLSTMKGGYPNREDMRALREWADKNEMGDVSGAMADGNFGWWADPNDGGKEKVAMGAPDVTLDQENNKKFDAVIKNVEREMNRIGDRLGQLNTKTSLVLNDANDGEARVASLINDFKSHLSELRQKF